MSEWIDSELHREFIAQQTDALRLCTCPDGWVERFGVDVLISHKTDAALERLKTELCLWALNVDFKFRRVFARFLPKQNADRQTPFMILGDPDTNLQSTALERTCATPSISAPDIPWASSSTNGRIAASCATWRRARCSTVSPTPVRFRWRPPLSARRR